MPYYAILRSIPHKTGGILAMFGSLLVLFLVPYINTSDIRNTTYRPIFKFFFWLFIADFVVLAWAGQKPVKDTFILTGQISTVFYFLFCLVFLPVSGAIEPGLVYYVDDKSVEALASVKRNDNGPNRPVLATPPKRVLTGIPKKPEEEFFAFFGRPLKLLLFGGGLRSGWYEPLQLLS